LPRSGVAADAGHVGVVTGRSFKSGYFRPIKFDQDMIRRAAMAMRENWSGDTYKLAAVALRAAIRNETDLLTLLPAAAPATPPRAVDRAAHAEA
jgi:hypothetical protein